jgi:hypothetical protein
MSDIEHDVIIARTIADVQLSGLISHYIQSRDIAKQLVATNSNDSINSKRGNPSGIGYSTPIAVIDAVATWKKAAISLSECIAEIGGYCEEEKIDPGKDP